jgi:hypothetical protein
MARAVAGPPADAELPGRVRDNLGVADRKVAVRPGVAADGRGDRARSLLRSVAGVNSPRRDADQGTVTAGPSTVPSTIR